MPADSSQRYSVLQLDKPVHDPRRSDPVRSRATPHRSRNNLWGRLGGPLHPLRSPRNIGRFLGTRNDRDAPNYDRHWARVAYKMAKGPDGCWQKTHLLQTGREVETPNILNPIRGDQHIHTGSS